MRLFAAAGLALALLITTTAEARPFTAKDLATQDRVDGNFRTGSGSDGTGLVGSEQRTPGFATVDAALTWKPRPNVRLTVGVENIFNTAYREHIERSDIDDPFTSTPTATGRSFYMRGLVRF